MARGSTQAWDNATQGAGGGGMNPFVALILSSLMDYGIQKAMGGQQKMPQQPGQVMPNPQQQRGPMMPPQMDPNMMNNQALQMLMAIMQQQRRF